jgi:hypothetical protein
VISDEPAATILGPYVLMHDLARLRYGRILWKRPSARERLLRHWTDPRHPYADRFSETYRPVVEKVLSADPADDLALDADLRSAGLSLRVVVREIPPVFGSFY